MIEEAVYTESQIHEVILPPKEQLIPEYHQSLRRRFLNIGISVPALLLTIPIVVAAGIGSKIIEPGEPIFYQAEARFGKGGKKIKILKLRTMKSKGGQEVYSNSDPERISRYGRFLRRTKIDELPQLLNVLLGRMDFTGFRAANQNCLDDYQYNLPTPLSRKYPKLYLMTNPGLFGPSDLNGGRELSLEQRAVMDIDHVEHLTLKREIELMMKLPGALLRGRGLA